jgi:microcompartment protein CcmK/EutM
MFLCRVVGTVVSTIKHPAYERRKLLVVHMTNPQGKLGSGTQVVIDTTGVAGVGDWVLVASEGRAASELLGYSEPVPIREVLLGIIDRVEQKVVGQ